VEITPALFDHIAHLARLEVPENDREALRNDLQKMVSFFEKLNELDTTGVEPLVFPSAVTQVLRPDEALPGTPAEKVFLNAPQASQGYFLAPKVIQNPGN
jgi:aspartyl-tRNA(Asn)/glutamyl-tRNA(Gln) amidotransferase subunit C